MTPQAAALARLLDRCVQDGDCWTWTGCTDQGYGRIGAFSRYWWTHRLSYILLVGEIPDGLEIDHLCRNRACVNPEHLDPVPREVNIARGNAFQMVNARKTECLRGHAFTPENTEVNRKGQRSCKACRAIRRRTYQQAAA